MRRSAIAGLVLAALLSACGGTSFSDEVVAVEAAWLCDVPRFAFDEAVDIDAELTSLLAESGVDRAVYDDFKATLDDDAELRQRVSVAFDTVCGEG
ncbi:MAG: hypothetical protein QNJ88_02570 [Acidimicrobiia bacterium]|nr:hypothetical protein [Acidimicrobiia bacterium]